LPADEPTPDAVAAGVEPPAWLDETARVEWARLAPLLVGQGLLTELDTAALAAYCHAFSVWRQASDQIRKFGLVIKAGNGFPMQSPYVAIAQQQMATMRALLTEFGCTPSSRSTVTRAPTSTVSNPLDRFLHRKSRWDGILP